MFEKVGLLVMQDRLYTKKAKDIRRKPDITFSDEARNDYHIDEGGDLTLL